MAMWKCANPECASLNSSRAEECEYCGYERVGTAAAAKPGAYLCQDCHQPTGIKAGAIVVDGQYLCGECKWLRLKKSASLPTDLCGVEGCDKKIREHMDELSAHLATMAEKTEKLKDETRYVFRPTRAELDEALARLQR